MCFNEKFWKPCCGPQTPIFIFTQESSNSRRSRKSEKSDGAKNGLRNIRRILRKDSSRKIDAEGANESIRTEKSNVFISELNVFFHMNPGTFHLRLDEIHFENILHVRYMCIRICTYTPPHTDADVGLNNLRVTRGLTGALSTLDLIAPDLHRKPPPASSRGAAFLCRSWTDEVVPGWSLGLGPWVVPGSWPGLGPGGDRWPPWVLVPGVFAPPGPSTPPRSHLPTLCDRVGKSRIPKYKPTMSDPLYIHDFQSASHCPT